MAPIVKRAEKESRLDTLLSQSQLQGAEGLRN